jgi:hypothetical protein
VMRDAIALVRGFEADPVGLNTVIQQLDDDELRAMVGVLVGLVVAARRSSPDLQLGAWCDAMLRQTGGTLSADEP